MTPFGHTWQKTKGEPIVFDGELVVPTFRFDVERACQFKAKVLSANAGIRQALTVSLPPGSIMHPCLSGVKKSIIAWYDGDPEWAFALDLRPSGETAVLKVWNSWINEVGQEVAWIGYSRMIVEQPDPNA